MQWEYADHWEDYSSVEQNEHHAEVEALGLRIADEFAKLSAVRAPNEDEKTLEAALRYEDAPGQVDASQEQYQSEA